jgi:hypothetical protein
MRSSTSRLTTTALLVAVLVVPSSAGAAEATSPFSAPKYTVGEAEPSDLTAERITPDGMGALRMGMSRSEVEQAIDSRLPKGSGGPDCTNLIINGGPEGLYLTFSRDDRLVAITVTEQASAATKTAKGIHVGSSRKDVKKAYEPNVTTSRDESGLEEMTFTPRDAKLRGKVVTFWVGNDGRVEAFSAGESRFATLLPCGPD